MAGTEGLLASSELELKPRPAQFRRDQASLPFRAAESASEPLYMVVDAHVASPVRCTSAAADRRVADACISTIGQAFAGDVYIQRVFNLTPGQEPVLLEGMSRMYLYRFPRMPVLYHTQNYRSAAIVYTNEQSDMLDNQLSLRIIPGVRQMLQALSVWNLPKLAAVVNNMNAACKKLMATMTAGRSSAQYLKLIVIATQPEVQRQGLGTAVLRAITAAADRQQLPIYLEAIESLYVPWYERHGFKVAGECDVSRGVKQVELRIVQLMVRMPQPQNQEPGEQI